MPIEIKGMKALQESISKLKIDTSAVKVGFINGKEVKKAVTNEFGSAVKPPIPPRPFMKQTFDKHNGEWSSTLVKLFRKSNDIKKSLDEIGEIIASDIRDMIKEGDFIPNAPATIAKKGFDAPLRDTMNMSKAVDHEVIDK